MTPSLDVLRRVLSSYQQALDAAEKTTQQELKGFEKALEDFEQAAQQHRHIAQRGGESATS